MLNWKVSNNVTCRRNCIHNYKLFVFLLIQSFNIITDTTFNTTFYNTLETKQKGEKVKFEVLQANSKREVQIMD